MLNRFEWSEIIIIGAVGGIAGSCLAFAIRLGASIDNLLNFLGGAVGSGLAVIASLWLESRKRVRGLEQMMESLATTASVAMRFPEMDDELMSPLILTFQQSAAAFEASRLGASIENPLHQYAFQSALFWLKRALKEMEESMEAVADNKITQAQFATVCRAQAQAIIKPIEDFLEQPGLPKQPLKTFKYLKQKTETETQQKVD